MGSALNKLFNFIKDFLGFEDEEEEDEFDLGLEIGENSESLKEVLSLSTKHRRDVNILDYKDRERYIRECCDQMVSASKDVESQRMEYQVVSDRLLDLEELASLPRRDMNEVRNRAKKILQIEADEAAYTRPISKITEAQYREMERLEEEMPGILKKMKEHEDYQMTVRRDLNLLEGEKGALAYQRKEERNRSQNAKASALIVVVAALMAVCFLLILQFTLKLDVLLGFYIVAGICAIFLTAVCVSYRDAILKQEKIEKKLNRTVLLQNTVKVKYVNTTNLIDYLYAKYHVNNSYELQYMWEKYLEEKEARAHSENVAKKMEEARKALFALLEQYHVKDPSLWLYQPSVLVYEDEMTEVRHSLIIQRQRLKKGIDFHVYNLESSKKEIEEIIRDYPEYAREILAIVSQYEE